MDYRTGVIQPAECLRAGWRLVRDRYWQFLAIVAVGLVIGSLAPLGIFMGPMVCGIYACLFRRMRGEEPSFRALFGGFEHFVQSFVATLVQIVPIMAPAVPVNLLMAMLLLKRVLASLSYPWPQLAAALDTTVIALAVGISTIVIFVLSVVVGTFFMFSYPLIEDRRVSGWASVKLSARASRANFAGAATLMATTTLLSVAGSLLCGVGSLLVTPVTLAAWAVAYRSVFPEPEER
jgi:uncharacterized membrane protein